MTDTIYRWMSWINFNKYDRLSGVFRLEELFYEKMIEKPRAYGATMLHAMEDEGSYSDKHSGKSFRSGRTVCGIEAPPYPQDQFEVENMIDVVYAWFSEEWGEEIPKCKRCLKKLKTNKPLSSRVVYSSNST